MIFFSIKKEEDEEGNCIRSLTYVLYVMLNLFLLSVFFSFFFPFELNLFFLSLFLYSFLLPFLS